MTNRFIGPGGSDAADGLTWANRKLTHNGVEDSPVAAADNVYVGPGVYRELMTVDVGGTAGNPITYIADVTGENTDGVGGIVRITGSDNDTTATRASCISTAGTARDYRTFRGFMFDMTTGDMISVTGGNSNNWIIEDCHFEMPDATSAEGIIFNGDAQTAHIVRRCVFIQSINNGFGIQFIHTADVSDSANLVENCDFTGGARSVNIDNYGGITVKNCTFLGAGQLGAVRVSASPAAAQVNSVNNCIFQGCTVALQAVATTDITENFNTFWGNSTDRTNVNTGANSQVYPALFWPFLLRDDYRMPQMPIGTLSEWSAVRRIAGTGESADDIYGTARPATAAKNSWGAHQFVDSKRETTTTRTGGVSMILPDAGRIQMLVPVTAVSTVFSVYVQREADYTGTNPQMIIRQPGVADVTITDAGAASVWNQLTTTLTPSAGTDFVVVELVSNNTAAAGAFDCFFDDLVVS